MERLEEITSVILNTISNQKNSLSIVDLAELTGIHRNVLAKYIKVLEAQGKIEISRVGAKKFVHLSHRVSLSFLKVFTTYPFFIFDRHLTVVDHNDEISILYELEKINSELSDSQKRLLNIFLTEEVTRLLQDGIVGLRSETIITTKYAKTPHSYSLTIIPIVFDNGRPGSALIIEDNTKQEEEKKICDQIKIAYRELLENQVQFVVRFNRDYKIITTNSIFAEHTGIEERLLVGSQFIPPYPEENYKVVITQMSTISEQNPEVRLDIRRINKSGDFSWERWNIRAVFEKKSKKVFEYLAVGLDITELKRTEHEFLHLKNNLETIIHTRTIELREVNNELHKEIFRREGIERELVITKFAIDSAQDFIFLLNSEGNIQYMNTRARENLAKADDVKINIKDIMTDDVTNGVKNPFNLPLNEMIDAGILTIKGSLQSISGKTIPVEITISRIIEQGDAVFCCIARDITDRTKIERDLFKYRKHLEEIIDERTKRLQHEVDEKNNIQNKLKKTEEHISLYIENSNEAVFIYNYETKQYQDINHTAELMLSINRKKIEKSVPEIFSKILLNDGRDFNQYLEEKEYELKKVSEIKDRLTLQCASDKNINTLIILKKIQFEYQRYLRIGILDLSFI